MKTRVVVTGIGILAANGTGIGPFWKSLLDCESGIGPISLFDASTFSIRIAGEVKGFDLSDYTNGQFKPKRLGRHTQLAIAALQMAIEYAQLNRAVLESCAPVHINIGVSTSAIDIVERGKDMLTSFGPKKVSPYIVSACQPHAIANALCESLGLPTQSVTFSTACSAGLDAIASAAGMIRLGKADMVIAGGADAPINPLTVASFSSTGMVPSCFENPKKASQPFDRNRVGGIMAEGACMLILESLDHALARGAKPLAEITGYGSSNDRPSEEPAAGLASSMSMALSNAGCLPKDIEYICAHGPSDRVIDRIETAMIKKVFGAHAYRIPVSSIKGVTGNPLAAAGPFQIAACAMGMQEGRIPPTANYDTPDPECDLDYVPNKAYFGNFSRAMVNVHGLGGANRSVVIQKVDV